MGWALVVSDGASVSSYRLCTQISEISSQFCSSCVWQKQKSSNSMVSVKFAVGRRFYHITQLVSGAITGHHLCHVCVFIAFQIGRIRLWNQKWNLTTSTRSLHCHKVTLSVSVFVCICSECVAL